MRLVRRSARVVRALPAMDSNLLRSLWHVWVQLMANDPINALRIVGDDLVGAVTQLLNDPESKEAQNEAIRARSLYLTITTRIDEDAR